jgi:hypothetical protein
MRMQLDWWRTTRASVERWLPFLVTALLLVACQGEQRLD